MDRAGLVEAGRESTDTNAKAGRLWLTAPAAALLGICALIDLGRIYEELRYIIFIRRFTFGLPDPATYAARAHEVNVFANAEILVAVPTAIVFIIWFRRAYRNLDALGIFNLRWSGGWAVGAWFVPFLNLVRPARIAADIWRGGDATLPRQSPLPEGRVAPALGWWWGTWLGSGAMAGTASLILNRATSTSDLETASLCRLVGEATNAAAAVFAIVLVLDVANRQELRAAVLAGRAHVPSPTLRTPSLTAVAAGAAPVRPVPDVEHLATPGGIACPACGFENHELAVSCVKCHKRLGG